MKNNPHWQDALIFQINEFCHKHQLNNFDIMKFLSTSLADLMATRNYRDDFAKIVFEDLYDEFKRKKTYLEKVKNKDEDRELSKDF